jgi:hypothetical protein
MSAERSELRLADIDRDGAIGDAAGRLLGQTRGEMLAGSALGAAAVLLGRPVAAAAESRRDIEILNFALQLDYVQEAFYTEVERLKTLDGELAEQARTVGAHERAHVKALRETLGARASRRPRFDFRGATESAGRFRRTAVAFEDLAVAAYKGQAPRIAERSYLVAALAIHSVEARHAAWIRRLAGIDPAAEAFDKPRSKASTLEVVRGANFTVMTSSRSRPRFTG